MKILHVNHLLDPVTGGGTAVRTIQLSRFLKQELANCGILCLDIGHLQDCENKLSGIDIYKLPCLNQRFFIPMAWPNHISRIIGKYDVVHLMGHWTLLNIIVAIICMYQKKPYVICPAGALKSFGRSRLIKWGYDVIIGRRIIQSASAWIAITDDEKKDFTTYNIEPNLVEVIPNGVDPTDYELNNYGNSNFSMRERFVLNKNPPYILFLGRLNKIKGPDLLLDAFSVIAEMFPDLHLVFAGPDSGMLAFLQEKVEEAGLVKKVHFAGYLEGEEKCNILRGAQCLVIPSREEAMSIVILEAAMCNTPVIFTDRCGLESFEKAGAGMMVSPLVGSISNGLIQALSDLTSLRETGERLRGMVNEQFLWSSQVKRYMSVYQKLLNDGSY